MSQRIILIDNYDSFTHNLARYIQLACSFELIIIKNDEYTLKDIINMQPTFLVISPGPGNPSDSGISLECINYFKNKISILGICLGHQCIAQHFGAAIIKAKTILHGKTSNISYKTDPIFNKIPNNFTATRYHSLAIEKKSLPPCLEVIAHSETEIMAIKHKTLPIYGLQFHPEAYLTTHGQQLIINFFNSEILK